MLIKLSMPVFWYRRRIISYLLLPFSFVYRFFVFLRRLYYKSIAIEKIPVPVIIVGNIVVGGVGKTPLVISLANTLKDNGYNPGIITRGYGRKHVKKSLHVDPYSKVEDVGDEALFISRRTGCPVVVNTDRVAAAKELISNYYGCDVIISDDGLQHYALGRDIEIVVVDDQFKFGNGFCLPAGPLRESTNRLNEVDFIIHNLNMLPLDDPNASDEYSMFLIPVAFRNIKKPEDSKTIADFKCKTLHAVAGIGRPEKFFQGLKNLGLTIIEHPFPDHHQYSLSDFQFDAENVIMTEKDAVKCNELANENFWYMETEAILSDKLVGELLGRLTKHRKLY